MIHGSNKKRMVSIIIVILILCIAGTVLYLVSRRRPAEGIVIHPQTEWMGADPVYYRQNDPAWGEEKMGEASDTLARSGCLVACLAASMEQQMKTTDVSYEMTPKDLNKELSTNKVYDDRANILWKSLQQYLSDWTVQYPPSPDAAHIEEMLMQGRYPIVRVRMPRSGANHWVMLMEARDGEYYCMDPLEAEDKMVPLSKFGSMVYSVRCLTRN